jgi:alpha-beta hydrolase superfamily lysophospholipase/predicted outer membrane lipoprotein
MRQIIRWCRRRPVRTLAGLVLAAFVVLNALAYQHAHAMTHFVAADPAGPQGRPESLSLWEKGRVLLFGVRRPRPRGPDTPARAALRFTTHTVPGRDGGLEAWYVPSEVPGAVVLVFHGYGGCKARMLSEVEGFHALGCACFAVDFRGCGGSAGEVTTVGYREADDVADAADYARARWPGRPLVLFGQSMGAAAVLRAVAGGQVRPDAVVLECPFDRMLSAVRARFGAMNVPSFPFAETLVFWGGVQHGFNAFGHNPVDYARSAGCPVLLLHGAADARVRLAEVRAIHDALPGEKALHVFAGLGHQSYARASRAEWEEQVGAFLGKHAPAAAR